MLTDAGGTLDQRGLDRLTNASSEMRMELSMTGAHLRKCCVTGEHSSNGLGISGMWGKNGTAERHITTLTHAIVCAHRFLLSHARHRALVLEVNPQ